MRKPMIHTLARGTVAFVWLWHGVVPKLLFLHPDELAPLLGAGFSEPAAKAQVLIAGWVEVAIGLTLLVAWRARWPLWLTLVLMPAALVGVTLFSPWLLKAAFNPMTLNVSLFVLATIALATAPGPLERRIQAEAVTDPAVPAESLP